MATKFRFRTLDWFGGESKSTIFGVHAVTMFKLRDIFVKRRLVRPLAVVHGIRPMDFDTRWSKMGERKNLFKLDSYLRQHYLVLNLFTDLKQDKH